MFFLNIFAMNEMTNVKRIACVMIPRRILSHFSLFQLVALLLQPSDLLSGAASALSQNPVSGPVCEASPAPTVTAHRRRAGPLM